MAEFGFLGIGHATLIEFRSDKSMNGFARYLLLFCTAALIAFQTGCDEDSTVFKNNDFSTEHSNFPNVLLDADISMAYNNTLVIRIGVPMYREDWFRFSTLRNDLESRFDIHIEFVDIGYGAEFQQDIVDNLYYHVRDGKVDMVLGFPSNTALRLIENSMLLDLTYYVDSIDNLHSGIVQLNKEVSGGRLYTISPVITNIQLLFTNQKLMESLNMENEIPDFISWYAFAEHLDNVQELVSERMLSYRPLSLEVGCPDAQYTIIARSFLMTLLGSESPFDEYGQLTVESENFLKTFAMVADRHGITSDEVLNLGGYPWDFTFANGEFAHMLGELSQMERLLNAEFNNYHNNRSPWQLNVDFPISVSAININGGYVQNLRETALFINLQTEHKDLCIRILNYLLSEEHAKRIIASRFDYSHFSPTYIPLPAFFNEYTIALINEAYNGNFCVSLIYSGKYASAIDSVGTAMFADVRYFRLFEDALTNIIWRENDVVFEDAFSSAALFINQGLHNFWLYQ